MSYSNYSSTISDALTEPSRNLLATFTETIANSFPICAQLNVKLQLLIFLFYLGMNGPGAKFSVVGSKFHVSKVCAAYSFQRVLKVVLSFKDEFIKWPSADERRVISERILATYGFPSVIGTIDGT